LHTVFMSIPVTVSEKVIAGVAAGFETDLGKHMPCVIGILERAEHADISVVDFVLKLLTLK
jgi:hypothetical protein